MSLQSTVETGGLLDFTLIRVDNRLVHGQILEAWLPYVKASCIVIADDEVANDFFRETVIKMAVPRDIEVLIYSIEEFGKSHVYDESYGRKAILLFSSIADSLRCFDLGFKFRRLNIGNVYSDQNYIRCGASLFLSESDMVRLKRMSDAGVRIDLRCVPRDKSLDFKEIGK